MHPMSRTARIDELLDIMARLRNPDGGCPWDLKQTFETILPYTLEEAYEVAEAIENQDLPELRGELGDLLFQVVFHARMAEEQGAFAFPDVVAGVCEKLKRRHPHVFGDASLADERAVNANWEREKAAERAAKAGKEQGVLAGVANALPALVRAEKLQRRAARVGFDWDDPQGVLEKVREEVAEVEDTLDESQPLQARVHEIGDLLFSVVNLSRHLGVDAEQALRAANHRFEGRFGALEQGLAAEGKAPSRELREQMEQLWLEAKRNEGDGHA